MLKFHDDAIVLSGLTGSKLKSKIINDYYQFWWNITSGGPSAEYRNPTAIIDLFSATGEIFIEETEETILGSAGHALQLKFELDQRNSLKVILIEENKECYKRLNNVILKNFPEFSTTELEVSLQKDMKNIFLFNLNLDEALRKINLIDSIGNAIFLFDPLLMIKWKTIEEVARNRIRYYYSTGTEFIIFLFTSDFFIGRKEFSPLPVQNYEALWTADEKLSVIKADELFGHKEWRQHILTFNEIREKERLFVECYKNCLHKWFRYVLPLPFNPKDQQLYHLFYCSNYEAGFRRIRDDFLFSTKKPKFNPENFKAYRIFCTLHPELVANLSGNSRPLEWKILWDFIIQQDGIRDRKCTSFKGKHSDENAIQKSLDWLLTQGYIEKINVNSAWYPAIPKYQVNWVTILKRLKISKPLTLTPISNEEMVELVKQEVKEKRAQSTLFDGF